MTLMTRKEEIILRKLREGKRKDKTSTPHSTRTLGMDKVRPGRHKVLQSFESNPKFCRKLSGF